MAINVLDSNITNLIAAGEVVEKPASIVKELVDNSIDAGAKNITIEIRNGGIDYIKISDDGCGIDEQDIKKAFLPHATSKIKSVEDLDSIFTLGFRGEALASIASVSQTTMRTKTIDSEYVFSIDVFGGDFGEVKKSAGYNGTTIEVKNLFYNTPARRKFLRRPKQEENEITNVVSRFILSKPNIKFKYIVEDKIIFSSKGTNLLDAISCVYDMNTAQNVLEVDAKVGDIHLYGYVSKVAFTKPNTSYQTLLVNGRYVVDESVSKAVYMAYDEFLMSRQFPFFVLNIDIPFTEVDVNVHPNKLSIKFSKPSVIFDLVFSNTRKVVYNSIKPQSSTPSINIINSDIPEQPEEVEIDATPNIINTNYNDFADNTISFSQSFGGNVSIFDKFATNSQKNILENKKENNYDKFNEQKLENKECNSNTVNKFQAKEGLIEKQIEVENQILTDNQNFVEENIKSEERQLSLKELYDQENDSYTAIDEFGDYKIIGELFKEFIILEHQDKMILLDFHAGHERLLYDELLNKVANKQIVIQDLLFPYVQKMTPKEVDYILNFKDELEKIGFGIDQFSNDEIKISYIPLLVKDINLKQFVDDLLHDMNSHRVKIGYEIDSYLMRTACRSAVKAGQTLNELQIKQLLKNLDIKKPVLLCPHGRPIVTVVARSQIEKWFKRIV